MTRPVGRSGRILLILLAAVAVLSVLAAGSAAAQEVVSDNTATGNQDANCDDRTVDHQDIQDAVDAASPGDTIIVCPGVYEEAVVVDKRVRIVADNPETTVDTERSVLRDVGGNGTAFAVQADDVSVEGFSVRNYSSAGVLADGTVTGVSGLTVNRSAIEDSGAGVLLSADGTTVSNTTDRKSVV